MKKYSENPIQTKSIFHQKTHNIYIDTLNIFVVYIFRQSLFPLACFILFLIFANRQIPVYLSHVRISYSISFYFYHFFLFLNHVQIIYSIFVKIKNAYKYVFYKFLVLLINIADTEARIHSYGPNPKLNCSDMTV